MEKCKFQIGYMRNVELFFEGCKHSISLLYLIMSSQFLYNICLANRRKCQLVYHRNFPTIFKIYFLLKNYFYFIFIKWSRILLQLMQEICSLKCRKKKKKTDCKSCQLQDSGKKKGLVTENFLSLKIGFKIS